MTIRKSSSSVRYIAEVLHAREVTLYGVANLAAWNELLSDEKLVARNVGGHASVIVSSVASRWMGMRFREFVVAVFVEPMTRGRSAPELFLASAVNTSRIMAWMERTFFATPYRWGGVNVIDGEQACCELLQQGVPILTARQGESKSPSTLVDEPWEGPIHLPTMARQEAHPPLVFYARLSGLARVRAFDSSVDQWLLQQNASSPLVKTLAETAFEPTQWHVRDDARHARSRTRMVQ